MNQRKERSKMMTKKHLLYGFFLVWLGLPFESILCLNQQEKTPICVRRHRVRLPFRHYALWISQKIVRFPPKLKETHVAFTANRRPFPTVDPKIPRFHGGGLVHTRPTCAWYGAVAMAWRNFCAEHFGHRGGLSGFSHRTLGLMVGYPSCRGMFLYWRHLHGSNLVTR